jgi:transcription antitermination factor NusA-like protein
MKKTDIAMIILIAAIGVLGAFFGTKAILGEGATEEVRVKKVETISASIEEVDPSIFNSEAINPAVEVQVAEQTQQ